MAVEIGFIYGMSVGIEYHPDDGEDDLIKSALVIDLVILRIVFAFFKD